MLTEHQKTYIGMVLRQHLPALARIWGIPSEPMLQKGALLLRYSDVVCVVTAFKVKDYWVFSQITTSDNAADINGMGQLLTTPEIEKDLRGSVAKGKVDQVLLIYTQDTNFGQNVLVCSAYGCLAAEVAKKYGQQQV